MEPRQRIRDARDGRQCQAPVTYTPPTLGSDKSSTGVDFRLQDARERQRRSTAHCSRAAPPTVSEAFFHISVHLFGSRSVPISLRNRAPEGSGCSTGSIVNAILQDQWGKIGLEGTIDRSLICLVYSDSHRSGVKPSLPSLKNIFGLRSGLNRFVRLA